MIFAASLVTIVFTGCSISSKENDSQSTGKILEQHAEKLQNQAEYNKINNSLLMPLWAEDSHVNLEASGKDISTPDWVKSLIIVEVNIATASSDKTFYGMPKVLDHLAEMGVNGIWLTPINEKPHYGNYGIHTLNHELTGTDDSSKQWAIVRNFVNEAHKRNIRVFFDVVSWGVTKQAPLYVDKPEWFSGPAKPEWNGWLWNWKNPELCEWFSSRLVEFALMTGADGIRCDCAPGYAGYEPYRTAKKRLLSFGRKVVFISEHPSERRGVFDFDQLSFMYDDGNTGTRFPCRIFMSKNIVDIIKSGEQLGSVDSQQRNDKINVNGGKERFYSFPLSCHDNRSPRPATNLIEFAYQALFSPFIPIWYLGEEWGNPYVVNGWSWPNPVNWDLRDSNREFFEQIKLMIRIRRQYSHIFEYFPSDHKNSNIAKIQTNHPELLQAYVRFLGNIAIIIVPNNSRTEQQFQITIPYAEMNFHGKNYTAEDLITGKLISSGTPETMLNFKASIPSGQLGIYKVMEKP